MIGVFLADGFEESEGIITIDLLRRAGFDVKTISITDNNVVTSSHKIKLFTDLVWDEFNNYEYDVLVIPGGKLGVSNLSNFNSLSDVLIKHNNNGCMIAAICAGPSILGNIGLLKDIKYTCYPGFEDDSFEGIYMNNSVSHDKNIITGRSHCFTSNYIFIMTNTIIHINPFKRIIFKSRITSILNIFK